MKSRKRTRLLGLALCLSLLAPAIPQAAAAEAFDVTAVGVLDTDPQGSYVDFGSSYLWQVKFNKNLYPGPESDAVGDKLQTFVQAQYGDYIAINGKTVTEWNQESFNSVMIHIGLNDKIGQYFEMNTSSMLDGLLSGDTDNTVTFLPGLPAGDGEKLEKAVTFTLAAGSKEPFVRAEEAEVITTTTTKPVDPSTIVFDVAAVGVLDQTPQKGLHDFGSSYLWQIDFTKDFYDEAQLTDGRKDHIQSEIGDYIVINGKTVSQWNTEVFNSVQIHVATNPSFGQYLEMNTNSLLDGLVDESTDNTVTILKGFPCADGSSLENSVSYKLAAGSKEPFVRLDAPVDEPVESTTTPAASEAATTTGRFEIVDDSEPESSAAPADGSEEGGPGIGLIIGIAVAVVVIAGGIAVLVLWKKGILFKKHLSEEEKNTDPPAE